MPRNMRPSAYTAAAWAALTANPADRSEAIRALTETLRCRFVSVDRAIGEYNGVVVLEAANDTRALATALAAVSPGHRRATKATRLIPRAEMMEAMRKSQSAGHQAPLRQSAAEKGSGGAGAGGEVQNLSGPRSDAVRRKVWYVVAALMIAAALAFAIRTFALLNEAFRVGR